MTAIFKEPDKGDPSDIQQVFPRFDFHLLCCRYWWLKNWEFNELSNPYWRIYHNNHHGARINFNGKDYYLGPDKIALIMPNTPFSTRLYNHTIPEKSYVLKGGRIMGSNISNMTSRENLISHLFIHFNLGSIYDNAKPGVFLFDSDSFCNEKITAITKYIVTNYTTFNFQMALTIQSLVASILMKAPGNVWELPSNDSRILDTLNYIETNPTKDLTNLALARRVGLAINSFTRLFTNELDFAPQRYVKKRRINKASVLLHHTHKSIDEIATRCGFADRYHFSRVFKQVNNISPAKYRRDFMMR